MSEFDLLKFEEEAHERWLHAFESNPGTLEKFYLNVAYPYPSGAMHVGHGRTYIVPDVIARFWRMRGRQVLYPMAFHVTGAPVIGISKRIARRDEKTIRLYRDLYKVPQDVLDGFVEPLTIVRHFASEYQRVMTACGLSIDWRRRFTTVDPTYSKFIEWQWKHLYEAGHVIKGVHPVRYCTVDDNPVGDHDLLEGDKAEVIKFTLVMFRFGDSFIPTATLRPETIHGVTNLWANPDVTYVKALVDGKAWIVSKEAAEKLALQDHTVEVQEEVPGRDLVDKKVSHPLCGEISILPAGFVDPDMASGLVMSVPAHAPFDYIALRDLQQAGKIHGDQADPPHQGRRLRRGPRPVSGREGRHQEPDGQPDGRTHPGDLLGRVLERKTLRQVRREAGAGGPGRGRGPDDREVRLRGHVRVRRPPGRLPLRQPGQGQDPPRPVVPEIFRPGLEAAGLRPPEGHDACTPRGPARVRPHG